MIIRVLALLLATQLALTVFLYWPRAVERGAPETLVNTLTAAAVERVTVGDGESAVTLERSGDGWLTDNGLPADGSRVATLLAALLDTAPGYAIADSAGAAERFRVADDDFERRVDLDTGAGSARVYLGSSPSFRKIHARRDGDDAVYVVELNSYDAPSAAASWLDRGLAALTDVSRLQVHDGEYHLDSGRWVQTIGPEDAERADSDAVAALVQVLAGLQVTGLATAEDSALAGADSEALVLSAGAEGADGITLTLFENEGRYFLRSSAFAPLFSISSYDAEQLLEGVSALHAAGEIPVDGDTGGAAAGTAAAGEATSP